MFPAGWKTSRMRPRFLLTRRGHKCAAFARVENGFALPKPELFAANVKLEIALQYVNSLVLFVMQVRGAAAAGSELESAHRTARILAGDFAIDGFSAFAAQFVFFAESILSRADCESRKHILTLHFLVSFQVLNGFVDGFNQSVRPIEILFQDSAMRLQRRELFEIGLSEDSLNLFQLETELAVEKNLLQGQELLPGRHRDDRFFQLRIGTAAAHNANIAEITMTCF